MGIKWRIWYHFIFLQVRMSEVGLVKVKLFILVILFFVVCGAVFGKFHAQVQKWSEANIVLSEPKILTFEKGTTLAQLSKKLSELEVITHPNIFRLWLRYSGDYRKFQAGLYKFEGEVSPKKVANDLLNGRIYTPLVLELTIPEGWTYEQISKKLIFSGVGSEAEFKTLFSDKEFLLTFKIPSETLEGFLYPATYRFSKLPTVKEAITETIKVFWQNMPANYEQEVQAKGLGLKDAITFASLIELETKFEDEKSLVSEVIWRRLQLGISLGIDAAIIYGAKDYQGDITWDHLADKDNKYNTRIYKGLPPTPICSPSKSSMEAVLKPTNEGYLYYVLDKDTLGRHHFSKTDAEHNQYVKKLKQQK